LFLIAAKIIVYSKISVRLFWENPMSMSPTVVIADRSEAFLMYLSILLNRL